MDCEKYAIEVLSMDKLTDMEKVNLGENKDIENVEIETIEEELVIIFGEYTSDHGYYFRAIKKKLEKSISYFHYDGTYWKENDKKNTTGFYQTVRLKPGIYRRVQIVELRKKDEDYLKPW